MYILEKEAGCQIQYFVAVSKTFQRMCFASKKQTASNIQPTSVHNIEAGRTGVVLLFERANIFAREMKQPEWTLSKGMQP